ncbi:lytic transglycosylase domain-containing protein [Pseudoduganella namucuonensis]|uniref:Soluble lytic murein transglycosylase n=1 Tax=Pseudoduganella namucuonensis TaxID=1035707 RepID=A0A1I7GGB2_9BURK|nr:lytic transglycosylase domain-containing protein [Pseudoduganella namucuonensis]SFU47445.1 Soluble lytic murein transglycosylase [Pseudoduganella namucuonensis]
MRRASGLPVTLLCAAAAGVVCALAASAAPGAGPPDAAALTAEAARLEHGEGVPRDPAAARVLYCQAARAGHAPAQHALGWMLANGRGGARDDGAASLLFALAAAQGHAQAQAMLRLTPPDPAAPLPACMLPDLPSTAPAPEALLRYRDGPGQRVGLLVDRLAPQFNIDPELAMAIIAVESAYNARALSPKNAQGLMQLIPETAQRFSVRDAFDAEQNIRGGLAYLRWLLAYFKGDVWLVAAAYNAGEQAVERHGGVPPYAETRDYVKKIAKLYKKTTHPYQRDLLPATSQIPHLEKPRQ